MALTPALFRLADLRPGSEIGIDSRTLGRNENLEAFSRDIEVNGLLQPIGVWRDPETSFCYVAFGNRRFEAIKLIEERTNFVQEVPVVVLDCPREELMAVSTLENVSRLPLHPVDQYEAFADMAAQGMSEARIAERFGLTAKEVRQRRRIGDLHESVRTAWAAGDITEDAALAFACTPDKEAQAFLLLSAEAHQLYPHRIRSALLGDEYRNAIELAFVGEDAYVAAGGAVEEDLFGEDRLVMNPEILSPLVAAKIKDAADVYVAKGWKWAARDTDLDSRWSYLWETVKAADKARAGVVLRILPDGKLEAKVGYVKPEDTPAATRSAAPGARAKPDKALEPAETLALARRAQTQGLSAAFAADPTSAKIALIVTILCELRHIRGAPLSISVKPTIENGFVTYDELPEAGGSDAVAEMVALYRDRPTSQLDAILAQLVGQMVDCSTAAREGWNGRGVTDATVGALAALLSPAAAAGSVRAFLNLEEYFAGAKKDHALGAIREIAGDAEAAKWANRKKDDVAAEAIRRIGGRAWLPPSIRWSRFPSVPRETPIADAQAAAVDSVKAKRASRKAKAA